MNSKQYPIPSISSEKEFNKKVIDKGKPTIIIFKTLWSGDAFLLSDILSKVGQEFLEEVQLFSVDVEQLSILKERFYITQIPTVLFFRKGLAVRKIMQILPRAEVKLQVHSFLTSAKGA